MSGAKNQRLNRLKQQKTLVKGKYRERIEEKQGASSAQGTGAELPSCKQRRMCFHIQGTCAIKD